MAGFKRFAPGDVVWGPDAYHEDDPYLAGAGIRPWVVVSNDKYPGQGEQSLVCALTHTPTTALPSMLPLGKEDWEKGGSPGSRCVDTETVVTLKHSWVTKYSGRLTFGKVKEARKAIQSYL